MNMLRKTYSEEFKEAVVHEIESGNLSRIEASREYGVTRSNIKHWLNEYGRFRPERNVLEVVMKSEKERIAELEKALADAHMKIRVYDKIIEQAGKEYKADLKKNFGPAPCEDSGGKATRSKRSVKRSE